MQIEELITAQQAVKEIHCSDALLDYVQKLLQETRRNGLFVTGLSPRAGLALLQAARAWAALEGRNHVIPEDIQAVFIPLTAHRLQPFATHSGNHQSSHVMLTELLKQVAV